ncbi:MAG: NAD-dependent epimerase/dehydratase family protein [Zetaproteobacteria bacterium]|nr:NAD-dependent epimerase/dehydratase family protein [Zetaproteobacteria bacterium]
MSILVTGVSSGLGKYLYEAIGDIGIHRENSHLITKAQSEGQVFELIIHCAANTRRPQKISELYGYYCDNIQLTENLTRLKHKKFIYISSVDVYPSSHHLHQESTKIAPDLLCQNGSTYALSKAFAESIVHAKAACPTIFRCASLLGKYSQSNNLSKICSQDDCQLSLAAESELNFITYQEVLKSIQAVTQARLKGVFNLCSSENIKIHEICTLAHSPAKFGSHIYNVGKICNKRISKLVDSFYLPSTVKLQSYLKEVII